MSSSNKPRHRAGFVVSGPRDADRGSRHERGYTSKWVKAREGFLRSHPLCAYCERLGYGTPATVVDHIVAPKLKQALDSEDADQIDKARALFWDHANWQPLCKPHHDQVKQSEERRGQIIGVDLEGRPLDPAHPWNRAGG